MNFSRTRQLTAASYQDKPNREHSGRIVNLEVIFLNENWGLRSWVIVSFNEIITRVIIMKIYFIVSQFLSF